LKFNIFIFCLLANFSPSNAQANSSGEDIRPISEGLQPTVRIKGKRSKLSSLKERMAHYKVPGVSIAFLKDNKISWTHTEGVTDLNNNRTIDENTVFQAASISKPVFASALMKYRQDNGLNIDVDVNTLLKSWQLPDHQWASENKVTLRKLLSHSAGTTVHGFAGYTDGSDVPSITSLLNGVKPANSAPVVVDIEPGTQFRYSGGGTTLAQLVLQDQTKSTLTKLAKKTIFEPLMMQHSSFSQPLIGDLKSNAAVAHDADGKPVVGGAHTYATLSAAGLWTTPSDLLRLVSQINLAESGKNDSFFSKSTIDEMLTPQIAPMGIGFFLEGDEEVTSISHGGSNEGFMAHLFAHTKTGDGIVVMTNGENGTALIDEIMIRASEIYNWDEFKPTEKVESTLTPKLFKSILGEYKITEPFKTTLVITEERGEFVVNIGKFVKNEMFFPESERQLFSMTGMSLFLHPNDKEEVNHISFWGGINAIRDKK
jgi:CubicO group peptidase (beta-lactamase class C family)